MLLCDTPACVFVYAPAGGEELLLVLATCLPALTRLSMAWSAVTALPALPGLQVRAFGERSYNSNSTLGRTSAGD